MSDFIRFISNSKFSDKRLVVTKIQFCVNLIFLICFSFLTLLTENFSKNFLNSLTIMIGVPSGSKSSVKGKFS
jgi:hypothetical protein